MKIRREEFLRTLEAVQAGLSQREIVEQSTCLCFAGGRVVTFNDEVSCSAPSPLGKQVQGAVKADKFLKVLAKLTADEVDVRQAGDKLVLLCPGERVDLAMQADILIPLDRLEAPSEWKPLPKEFAEAVGVVYQCAARGGGSNALDCVHLHPQWLEATDDFQVARWVMPLPVSESLLVRAEPLREAASLGVTEIAESPAWVHFRNGNGLVFSCRRYVFDYRDLGEFLQLEEEGATAAFPKGLVEALEKADIFSGEAGEADNQVLVELRPGKSRVVGVSPDGKYTGYKPLRYEGPEARFYISPKLLTEIVKNYAEVTITKDRLKVEGGKFEFVAALGCAEEEALQEAGT